MVELGVIEQARAHVPLGGAKPVRVEFSVIAATNRMLVGGSPEHFRSDLFFRIADYTVRLRPLRERIDRDVLIRSLWKCIGGREKSRCQPQHAVSPTELTFALSRT